VYNKHRKLFAVKQIKGCKFMPKMHQNTSGGRAPPTPAGGACARSPSRNGGVLLRGGREGKEERGNGKGVEGNFPKS